MDDLRAAVARAAALHPATRLVTIDAGDLVDATPLAVYAAFSRHPSGGPRTALADPLRLPLVAGIADVAVFRVAIAAEPQVHFREIWRILAPAGRAVLVIPLPRRYSLKRLLLNNIIRNRSSHLLAAAMFVPDLWQVTATALVVRAGKRDGLGGARLLADPVHQSAMPRSGRVRTKTA